MEMENFFRIRFTNMREWWIKHSFIIILIMFVSVGLGFSIMLLIDVSVDASTVWGKLIYISPLTGAAILNAIALDKKEIIKNKKWFTIGVPIFIVTAYIVMIWLYAVKY